MRVFVDVRVFVDASVSGDVSVKDAHGHGSGRVGTDDTQHSTVSSIDAVDAAANVDADAADAGVDVEQGSQYPYPPSHKWYSPVCT